MTLVINNGDVASVLTMRDTVNVLEEAYADLISREAVCRLPPPCEELVGVEIMAPSDLCYRSAVLKALVDNLSLLLKGPGSSFTPDGSPVYTGAR